MSIARVSVLLWFILNFYIISMTSFMVRLVLYRVLVPGFEFGLKLVLRLHLGLRLGIGLGLGLC
jgi:hypothetical protein